ncbi:MAG TPA: hypothetical protein VFX61_13140 [Micromonosporaceae bacterium]|nr:hypothetical protein [Micromonosporaceae bacterium]
MAVRIDLEAVRGAVDANVYRDAEELLSAGRVGEITAVGGGAAAVVDDGSKKHRVWVGVVTGAFEMECDCVGPDHDPEDFCAHAVALTMAAARDAFAWSAVAIPPSELNVRPAGRR